MKDLIRHILREHTREILEQSDIIIPKNNKRGIIYKITFINGKIYIGQDTQKDLKKYNPFYMGSFNMDIVYDDLIKTGYDGFSIPYVKKEILWESENTNRSEISKKECEFIREYKSYLPEIGYNRNKFKCSI